MTLFDDEAAPPALPTLAQTASYACRTTTCRQAGVPVKVYVKPDGSPRGNTPRCQACSWTLRPKEAT